MIRFRFGADDLLRTRFAITPLFELTGAFHTLRWSERRPVLGPWVRRVRDRAARLDLTLLEAATRERAGYWPVFLNPPPVGPHTTIDDELARVAATPPEQVRAEIERVHPGDVPPAARLFLDDPEAAVDELVVQMRSLWDVAVAPWWPAISALLEAEVAARARLLVAAGLEAALGDLHPTVSWSDGVLRVRPTTKAAADVDLAGRGLLLVPAAFPWPRVWPRTDPPWDPALVYPPAGVGSLWGEAPAVATSDPLTSLLGRGRARLLRELDRPGATTELAARLRMSAGGVSEHLTVLLRAGLATRGREGRRVVWSRTAPGDLLCGLTVSPDAG